MSDNVTVFDVDYTGVTGIKVKGTGNGTLTYIRPQGTKSITANATGIDVAQYASVDVAVEDSTFVVTLSYNESTEMWEPDKTFAEIKAAHEAGKTIVLISENNEALGAILKFGNDYVFYGVDVTFNEPTDISGRYVFGTDYFGYTLTQDGIYAAESTRSYELSGANATAADVTSGKLFYGPDGLTLGTSSGTTPSLQSKRATPTESAQTIIADSGYDGLSQVDIDAISSTYVGSGITQRSSTDLTASGATVTVPAGYYSAQASKAVASGTEGTPTATKGTVSNHSVSVTPSVTNTAGYISGGTKTGSAVTVSASELVSGSETKTANGTYDVTNLASLVVDIDFVTYYTSTSDPTSSQGSDGDIWLVTS